MSNLTLVERLVAVVESYVPFGGHKEYISTISDPAKPETFIVDDIFILEDECLSCTFTCHTYYEDRVVALINGKTFSTESGMESVLDNVAGRIELTVIDENNHTSYQATKEEVKEILLAIRNNKYLTVINH